MRQGYFFARPYKLAEEAERLLPEDVDREEIERFVDWYLHSPNEEVEEELERLAIIYVPVDALDWILSAFVMAKHYVPDEDEDLFEDPAEPGERLVVNAWELYTAALEGGDRWVDAHVLWDLARAVDEHYGRADSVPYGETRRYMMSLLPEYAVAGLLDLRTAGEGRGDTERLYLRPNWPEILRRFDLRRDAFEPDGYVYLLGGAVGGVGFYKIGRTVDPKTRIRQLGIQLPFPVSVEHVVPCEDHKASELALHDRYKDKRANGEWFRLPKADVEEIKSIRRMRGAEAEKDGEKSR